ncbi:CcdB family protein [Azospirillum sp.]|uniref:CcdB family protein n=1 Tax=Azospirillum sp. TaxID=34012 RepID=UPI002D37673F|nr:CcdB family protein [Azospirillum sp.]HYD68232.1 CcdB family protein [Azospirillum sp.]
MQYEVFVNPITRAQRSYPFVVVLQSDLADTGRDRIVGFMAPKTAMPDVKGRLTPIVEVDGSEFVVFVPSLTSVRGSDLGKPVDTVERFRDRITEALDWLFLGV